jgi:hypothetical protein
MMAVSVASGATATLRIATTASSAPATGTGELLTWLNDSGSLVLEIEDSNRNTAGTETPTFAAQTCAENANIQFDRFSTPAVVAPILDKDGDGIVTFLDVTVVGPGNVQIFTVDPTNGIIVVRCGAGGLAAIDIDLSYEAGAVNSTAGTDEEFDGTQENEEARIWSDADAVGLTVVLKETSAQSGIFRATVNLKATTPSVVGDITAALAASLFVNSSDTVRFSYKDNTTGTTFVTQSSTLPIETSGALFGAHAPSNGSATANNLPTVTGEMTDTDSGIVNSSAQIIWGRDDDFDGDIDASFFDTIATADLIAIDNGVSFTHRFGVANAVNTDHDLYWWPVISDVAGNPGVTDRQPTISGDANACNAVAFMAAFSNAAALNALNPDVAVSAEIFGCQPFQVKVDRTKPVIVTSTTGVWWDTSISGTDKTQADVTKAKKTSIVVNFGEAIDGATVQASDFKVDGNVPISATHFAGSNKVVFLEVAELAPDAQPKIEVIANVGDTAGNNQDASSLAKAKDGIAPTLGLTTEGGTRPAVKSTNKLTLDSDETASTANVTISVGAIGANTAVTAVSSVTVAGGPTSWTGTTPSALADGLYNVYGTAQDINESTNVGKKGQDTSTATALAPKTIDLTKAILYEVDSLATGPSWPLTIGGTDNPDTFIAAYFADEGKEYGLAGACTDVGVGTGAPVAACEGGTLGDKLFTTTPADVVTSFDSHKTVTLTEATLGGVDILSSITTADNVQFLYKASGLALGAHTVVLKYTDEAGNTGTATHTFTVAARAKTKVAVVPGWSMISFPGDPGDPSIDAVMGDTPVTQVYTYDPTVAGGWLVAVRERQDDGTFSAFQGNLTTISSGRGYWVLTDTFEPIEVDIPSVSGGPSGNGNPVTPPTIAVFAGWNLVPVIDITGSRSAVVASDYLTGLTVSRIYLFDTISGKWELKALTENLIVGKSYWVYVAKDGVVVP